ncbi:MAG: hypothetical protein HXX19_06200, partial [Rhodoferax sp.]|nr:hypothetical protein [Rhodoferax sp.]
MPFGPSDSELLLLLQFPLLVSLVLSICLLFSWRKFRALLAALVAQGIYLSVGIKGLHDLYGALMLLYSGWVA